ncbi:hypothetical protein [Paradesulfitobacterium ferrireducens]|uniref:hypothetical protein n=1 Tax=Paradesulfitobacterium ferrireducens TaxID=2816476 RepID=UPI001A8EF639|nr:hypothetical protein [Paradesulfitobacterium ferrireducens]
MLMLKVCHACDSILGEIELDDLTGEVPDSIMDIVGNVAYALCPDCMRQLDVEPDRVLH